MIDVQQEQVQVVVDPPTVRIPDAAFWWMVFAATAALVLLAVYLLS